MDKLYLLTSKLAIKFTTALWLGCICFLTSNVLIVNATPRVQEDSSAQENNSAQKLDQLKQAINQQKTTIKQVNNQRNKLEKQLQKSDLAISAVVNALAKTQQQLSSTQQKLTALEQQQTELLKQKNQQEQLLAKQLRAAYSSGSHDYIKLLLNQESPAKVQRSITYYQYLNNARIEEIEQFKVTIAKLHQVKVEQMEQIQKLEKLQQAQQEQQQTFSQQKTQREQTIAQLSKQLLNDQQTLDKLEQEEANLITALARIAKLSQQEEDLKGLSRLKRKLSWPVDGKIRRSFGSSKQGYLKWKGVLLSAPTGRQVTTIHSGTILFSDWLKGYGLVTVVDHGEGYMSLYGHNQALLKSVGDRVETGEPIALVGQSGGQEQPGLYFEIRHNGQAVNPKLWCR